MSQFERGKTERGFDVITFTDFYDKECTIQKSSLATDDAIWLGAAEIGLRHFRPGQGWVDVDLGSEHYVANNRMHLTREQVQDLLPFLQKFAETGEL